MQAASQVGDNVFCSLRLSLFTFMLLMGTYDILNVNVKLCLMGFLITIANKDKQYLYSKSYYDLPKSVAILFDLYNHIRVISCY